MEQLQLINTPTWKELQRWNKQRLEDDEDLETRRKELGLKNNSAIASLTLPTVPTVLTGCRSKPERR